MKKVLIASGKGGVGKSTLTVAISKELSSRGIRTGILDVDIDTPNIPEFMNIDNRDVELSSGGIVPKLVGDIEVMSIGLIADTDTAVMWNGERRTLAIGQMLKKVEWSCDVLMIDSPPGTTDEVMSVIKKFSPDAIIIVTTNHKASIADVRRTIAMIDILESSDKVLGIIKNMTHIYCTQCGEDIRIFENGDNKEIDEITIAEIPYLNEASQKEYDENISKIADEIIRVI